MTRELANKTMFLYITPTAIEKHLHSMENVQKCAASWVPHVKNGRKLVDNLIQRSYIKLKTLKQGTKIYYETLQYTSLFTYIM